MAREAWTDERLDDLKENVNQRFDRFESEVKARFDEVDKRFDRVDDKFDSLQRNMTTWFIALFSTIMASLITGVFALVSLT